MNKKVKRFISKSLITSILLSGVPIISSASTFSEDGRYEIFESNNIKVDNILEEDKVDVEIYGNTLISPLENAAFSGGSTSIMKSLESGRVVNDSSTGVSTNNNYYMVNSVEKKLLKLKPSTVYTVFISGKVVFGETNNNRHVVPFYRKKENGVASTIGIKQINVSQNTYFSDSICFTTVNKDMDSFGFYISGSLDEIESVDMYYHIVEGDWTDKEPPNYFEGVKSVGQNINSVEVTSSIGNPNLVKNSGFLNGSTNYRSNLSPTVTILNDSSAKSGKIMKVQAGPDIWSGVWQGNIVSQIENKEYVFSGWVKVESDSKVRIAFERHRFQDFASTNGEWVRFEIVSSLNPAEWNTVIFFYSLTPNSIFYIKDIKVEEYHKATPYIPHVDEINYNDFQYTNKKEFELKEPLRALPTGIKDKIINKNGQWVVERQLKEMIINGQESGWIKSTHSLLEGKDEYIFYAFLNDCKVISALERNSISDRYTDRTNGQWANDGEGIWVAENKYLNIRISKSKLPENATVQDFRNYLSNNPVKLLYQLENPIYEPLGVELVVPIHKIYTNLFNNSKIPASMKITVDRAANRAKEFLDIAKLNPTVENVSQARYWMNLMNDSILKDEFQDVLNGVLEIEDLKIDKKTVSANVDVYIAMKNTLSMSLDTNTISFTGYTGSEDLEMLKAVNITIDSSLPYNLNAYMPSGIYNSDKSKSMNINVLNLKESTESTYKQFTSTSDKLVLKENCSEGEVNIHSIDLKLSSSTHKADIYKTVLKFEAEQK